MSSGTVPTLHCDGDDGGCSEWTADYYELTVSTINGVPVTSTHRAPGWVSDRGTDTDYCPRHGGRSTLVH